MKHGTILLLSSYFLRMSYSAAEAAAHHGAAKLAKKAEKPQTIFVQVALTGPCEEKHTAVAASRIKLAAAGYNATYTSSCTPVGAKIPASVIIITFYDRAARTAFYQLLHKQIFKTKDKKADVAAFFSGLPTKSVSIQKHPSDPMPAINRKVKRIIGVVVIAMGVLAGVLIPGFYIITNAATALYYREKLPQSIQQWFPKSV